MKDTLLEFWRSFDYDRLVGTIESGEWKWLLSSPVVWVVGAVILALIAYKKTNELGTKLFKMVLVGGFYVVAGVAVKNSTISEIGPFLLALVMFLGIAGYFIWNNLIKGS